MIAVKIEKQLIVALVSQRVRARATTTKRFNQICKEVPLPIKVDTTGKPNTTQGQTAVIENKSSNAHVCLNPNLQNLTFGSHEVFISPTKAAF